MSVNISNIPQTSQLLQELGYIHYYSLQLLKSEPIVNNHKIKLLNSGSPIGNLLQVIRDIISWCPSQTTINIRNNKKIIQPYGCSIRKGVKKDYYIIINNIIALSNQKSVTIKYSRPISKPNFTKEVTWNNPSVDLPGNSIINNSVRESNSNWCKKIFNIIRSYIICESSSVLQVFDHPINITGLEILNTSVEYIKSQFPKKFSDLIAFRIKILSGTLPTRKILHDLYPDHYPDQVCPRCSHHTEDIRHLPECSEAEVAMTTIIRTINEYIKSDNNPNPVKHKWQAIELICGITHNIFSPVEVKQWTKASSEGLMLFYDLVWKPRSNTANTTSSSGISWKFKSSAKKIISANKIKKTNKKNTDNTSKSAPSNKSDISETGTIEFTSLVSEAYIQSNFNYKKCLSNLVSSNISFLQNSE
jgi:hypothetical protein